MDCAQKMVQIRNAWGGMKKSPGAISVKYGLGYFAMIRLMKKSTEDLLKKVEHSKSLVSVGGRYKHFKGGYYKVLDIAIIEADTEPCVIYEAEYAPGLSFVRPLSNWLQKVKVKDKQTSRFTLVN